MKLILEKEHDRFEFKIADQQKWYGYFRRVSVIYQKDDNSYTDEEGYYNNQGGYYLWEGNIEFVI